MPGKYMDENIRRVINQMEEAEEINTQSIYEGVTINKTYYEFEEKTFLNDRVKMYIPKDFTDLPPKIAKIKYPSGERPPIIKSNKNGSINITLNLIPNTLGNEEEQIPEVKAGIKNIYKKLNPSYLFFDEGIEKINEKTAGYLDYKSPALDATLYNLMFVAAVDSDILMSTFNCIYAEHVPWKPIAFQIMRSLKILPKAIWENLDSNGKGKGKY